MQYFSLGGSKRCKMIITAMAVNWSPQPNWSHDLNYCCCIHSFPVLQFDNFLLIFVLPFMLLLKFFHLASSYFSPHLKGWLCIKAGPSLSLCISQWNFLNFKISSWHSFFEHTVKKFLNFSSTSTSPLHDCPNL